MSEMVPEGWERRKLGDFCREKSFKFDGKSQIPVLSVTKYDGFVNSLDYFNKQVFSRDLSSYKIVRKGQFAYATIHLDEGSLGLLSDYESGLISPMYTVFETTDEFDSKYLFFLMKSDLYMQKYPALGQGSINRRASISFKSLSELTINSPPLPEQKKIASILTSVDEVIEKTQSQIDKLQDLKKGTMNELLTKGIGHTEFKDSELGRIPKSWEVVQVQDFARVIRGASPRPKGDPRYYGGDIPRLMGSDVTRDGKFVFPKTDFLTPEGAELSRPMKKGGLTIVCSGTVGVPSILGIDACIHDGFLGLVDISERCITEFLYYTFLPLQSVFDSSATHGGVFTNLTTEILKEFIVPIPPIWEQEVIISNLKALDEHIYLKRQKLHQTQSLKKFLMQDLLTGKVRVSVN